VAARKVASRVAMRAILRAEAAAGGMRALARALGVSPSTIHRWRTVGLTARGSDLLRQFDAEARIERLATEPEIRETKPQSPKKPRKREPKYKAVLDFEARRQKQSEAAKRGWAKRKLHSIREKYLGPLWVGKGRNRLPNPESLHGMDKDDWYVLRHMIQSFDPRYAGFMNEATELGFSDSAARDEWFSPEVK
jgi:hypothetical protein